MRDKPCLWKRNRRNSTARSGYNPVRVHIDCGASVLTGRAIFLGEHAVAAAAAFLEAQREVLEKISASTNSESSSIHEKRHGKETPTEMGRKEEAESTDFLGPVSQKNLCNYRMDNGSPNVSNEPDTAENVSSERLRLGKPKADDAVHGRGSRFKCVLFGLPLARTPTVPEFLDKQQ